MLIEAEILPISIDEWHAAMDFVWNTFLESNRDNMSDIGAVSFERFIRDERLYGLFLTHYYKAYSIKRNDEIMAVFATKEYDHISLLFVEKKYQKNGMGRAILSYIEKKAAEHGNQKVTVNAADKSEGFYKSCGYVARGLKQDNDGVITTPMVKFL